MSIRHNLHFQDQFTIVPNRWMRDPRLSWKARGLLAYLVGHRPGWSTSISALVDAAPEGRDAVKTGITELEEAGYLTRTQARDDAQRFAEVDYTITDPFAPRADYPSTADSSADNQPPKEEQELEDQQRENQLPRGRASDEQLAYLRDMYQASGRWLTAELEAEWAGYSITEADQAIRRAKAEHKRHRPLSPPPRPAVGPTMATATQIERLIETVPNATPSQRAAFAAMTEADAAHALTDAYRMRDRRSNG